MHRLESVFNFSSIAVVGASDSSAYGFMPYRSLQALGFRGQFFPVNQRRQEVHGLRAYRSVDDIPSAIEAALIVVARERVLPAVETCAERGARLIVVITGGFAEADQHGSALQAQIAAIGRERGALIVGPNCFGVASLVNRCAAFCGHGLNEARVGNVGVVSSSGGLLNEIVAHGSGRGMGFSHLASTGNEAGVTAADVLDYLVEDESTRVVLAVLEAARDPDLFVAAADRARSAAKPIVVLKLGASERAAQSVATHTGALAGSDAVYSALFRQKGIVRVHDLDELIEVGALLSGAAGLLGQRPLERAAVIEISGGGTALVCDAAAEAGVALPDLSDRAISALQPSLPETARATNPLDTGLNWESPDMEHVYPLALSTLASESAVDVIVSRYTVPRRGPLGSLAPRLEELKQARQEHTDRLFAVLSRTSDRFSDEWVRVLREDKIVFLQGYGRGMRALGQVAWYSRYLGRRAASGDPPSRPLQADQGAGMPDLDRHGPLNEVESKDLLRAAGLPVVPTAWARSAEEAVELADQLGYPVAAKVISPQILHKSDVGGVRLSLADAAAVRRSFVDLDRLVASLPEAQFEGVAVQPMAGPGLELVLGVNRDPQFGPVLLFGLGGIFVETLRDISLRVAPLTERDAEEMLDEIRGHALLYGARGEPAVDRPALVRALCQLADLAMAQPRLASVDLNPVFAYPDRIAAVDARVILD